MAAAAEIVSGADRELDLLCDLLAGPRSAEVDGPPGARRLTPGDPLLFDLAPRLGGYWADSCATFAVGRPSAALRARHNSVRAALEAGIDAARPGADAGEVDAAVRGRLEADGLRCPHHSGHGVGVAAQESPFLLPGEPTRLEEGMTIAIEPGAYGDGLWRAPRAPRRDRGRRRPSPHHPLTDPELRRSRRDAHHRDRVPRPRPAGLRHHRSELVPGRHRRRDPHRRGADRGSARPTSTPGSPRACIEAPGTHNMGLGLREMLIGADPLRGRVALGAALRRLGDERPARRGDQRDRRPRHRPARPARQGARTSPAYELMGGAARERVVPYASLQPETDSFAEYRDSLVDWARAGCRRRLSRRQDRGDAGGSLRP